MGVLRHCHRHLPRHHYRFHHICITALTFLLLASQISMQTAANDAVSGGRRDGRTETVTSADRRLFAQQKRLAGPGSSPPTCKLKCGRCSPCKPVHVPIQPGLSIPLEYYPEAWRCKCGDKLFMP